LKKVKLHRKSANPQRNAKKILPLRPLRLCVKKKQSYFGGFKTNYVQLKGSFFQKGCFLSFLALEKSKIAPRSRKETQRKFYFCDPCASVVKKQS
jgi:hypothetical protein